MRMNEGSPAAAAFAATELARFPVDAQPIASSLNSRALLIATAVTRSLKERVGELTLSFFKYRSSIPSFLLSRSANQRSAAGRQSDFRFGFERKQFVVFPNRFR